MRFLSHVDDSSGVSVDWEKVKVGSAFMKGDLMTDDGCTPTGKSSLLLAWCLITITSLLAALAKQLYILTAGQKRNVKGSFDRRRSGTFRKLTYQDWTPACEEAFEIVWCWHTGT